MTLLTTPLRSEYTWRVAMCEQLGHVPALQVADMGETIIRHEFCGRCGCSLDSVSTPAVPKTKQPALTRRAVAKGSDR